MKHKTIINYTKEELEKLLEDKNSCVSINQSLYNLALAPYHLENLSASIKGLLNAKVAKYDQRLDGILLGYKNLKLITPQAAIIGDSPYIHVDMQGDFYIFKPEKGSQISGVVNKTSKNHLGCLVHKVFNVSVPNKNENDDWIGFNVQVGDTVELLVDNIDLDARLPYIKASIISYKSNKKVNNKINFDENDASNLENGDSETPTKKKKKKKLNDLDSSVNKKETKTIKNKSKKNNTSLINNNISDTQDFKTPKEKKKRKSEENKQIQQNEEKLNNSTDIKDSLDDFITPPVEKKNKKRNSDKHEKSIEDIPEKSHKKKKHKPDADEENLNASKSKKDKKKSRKSEEIIPSTFSSPVKTMADAEDRKIKKRRSSTTQNVDWENKDLNLYDSDLEKTLAASIDKDKSLQFNLAKISALNDNTPRKRKRKETEVDIDNEIQPIKKKHKSKKIKE